MLAMMFVIGSGPAGVACAKALLDRGAQVTMLDVGIKLEEDRAAAVAALSEQEPSDWDQTVIRRLKEGMQPSTKGVPKKTVYGSDYPYQQWIHDTPIENHGVETRISRARGGFSNVWGAAMLPFRQRDMADWPITAAQLEPYYREVLSYVPLSAVKDDLEERFALHTKSLHELRPSTQAARLLQRAEQHRQQLHSQGIRVGRARVALRGDACRYCGLCSYGCPYSLIYSTAQTLDELMKHERFTYVADVLVDRIEETATSVRIHTKTRTGTRTFIADRVFLGAGVMGTALILMNSGIPGPLTLQDTQSFLISALQYRGTKRVREEQLHTMAQVFIEVENEKISPHSIHMQVYTYNEMHSAAVRNLLGKPYHALERPLDMVMGRLCIIIGMLHSKESSTIQLRLEDGRLVAQEQKNPATTRAAKRVTSLLRKHHKSTGLVPIPGMTRIATTGTGIHYGGTFPMRAEPKDRESDLLGRLHGFQRTHIIDASIFPSIPATTIVLTIMANATRIAAQCIEKSADD
jgi:choline dehydrogenase-like flavoprotein